MKTLTVSAVLVAILGLAAAIESENAPMKTEPAKEHEWLQRFVGQWDSESTAKVEPGQPPVTCKGTESIRTLGELWIISEAQATVMDTPVSSVFTLGYDPAQKKFVGTWIDSCNAYLWHYVGTLDSTGTKLTLDTEGPLPHAPDKVTKFREVIEFKNNDHKLFTSSMLGDDGNWQTFMTANYHCKK